MLANTVSVPLDGPLTSTAVSGSSSASVSLNRTLVCPEASTVWVPPSATVRLSAIATGGSLTAFTVIEAVAGLL